MTEGATPIVGATLFVPFPTSEVSSTRVIVLIPDTYHVNARSDISVNAEIVQVLVSGTQWPAVGRTIDSTWLYLQLDNERFAWVFRETIGVSLEVVNALPIIVPDAYQ